MGGAAHSLRTIRQGPDDTLAAGDVWALFLLADRENRTLRILSYSLWGLEKQFGALAWQPEHDADGNRIYVDYYYQAPLLEGVTPGSYEFLTLIDSHDRITEVFES